jgi:hypothetical protein
MLEALSWLQSCKACCVSGRRSSSAFRKLATHDGLLSFTGRAQLMHDLNVRRSRSENYCGARTAKIIRLTSRTRIIAIIGPDFIRTLWTFPSLGQGILQNTES